MPFKKDDLMGGYVYAPYVMAQTVSPIPDSEYDIFIKEYNEKHKYCPKCGELNYSTTLIDYVMNRDRPYEYKDMNRCKCSKCGDSHITHDRISKIGLRALKLKDLKIK